jgi:hypothetical protein
MAGRKVDSMKNSKPRFGRSKFFPGWKMTWDQRSAYFRLLEGVYAARGIRSAADKETTRKLIHERAFGSPISAKEIDHMKMFDAFKATCLAESRPTDVDAQLHQVEQPLIRLRYAIRQLADEGYIMALLRSPRFKKHSLDDLESMDEKELTDLRNTLAARMSGWTETAPEIKAEPVAEPQEAECPF